MELMRSRISAGLHVMIRPGGGNCFYSLEEFETTRRDIMVAKKLGRADGVVLGILDAHGNADIARSRELVELARPLHLTCHRAFDMSADLFVRTATCGYHWEQPSGANISAAEEDMVMNLRRAVTLARS